MARRLRGPERRTRAVDVAADDHRGCGQGGRRVEDRRVVRVQRPTRLSSETVSHIHDIAAALNYRPDPVARSLAQRRTGTLGILTPQSLELTFNNPYHAAFAAGVAVEAERAGYALQFISPLHGSLGRAVDRASVDGIIAVGLSSSHPEVARVRRSGMRLVVVDAPETDDEPSISIDNEGGGRMAAEHLLGLGHRRFLVLGVEPPAGSGGKTAAVGAARMRGYRTVLRQAGINLGDEDLVIAPTTIEGGRQAFHAAWGDGLRPTAVLAMSDATAIGALHAAREQRIPSRPNCRSSGSTTSTWRATPTRH